MTGGIYEFKTSLKQQLILLGHLFFVNVALIIVCRYYLNISLSDNAFIITFIFLFFIDALPTIIVHTQYWIRNRNVLLTLNTKAKELIYTTPTKKLKYSFDRIASLQYYRNLGKGSGWNSFGEYRYYKIIFDDKSEIVITCLMINDIENTFKTLFHIQAEWHAKLLCLIE